MTSQTQTVRLKVSPAVARIVAPEAPRAAKLDAARGALPLPEKDRATLLFFLCHGGDAEVRGLALDSFRRLSADTLLLSLETAELPQFLDFVARFRLGEPAIIRALLVHPSMQDATLLHIAGQAPAAVLTELLESERCLENPEVLAAMLVNPCLTDEQRVRLVAADVAGDSERPAEAQCADDVTGDGIHDEETSEEELNLSKYQLALEMGVSDKIKMALTGDKEWRNIFLKDPNKLVSSAVLKNPRITDGEVLVVAKNKSSNDELIRLITLNREWVKNYEIKRALVLHPRTPLPKALRYMDILTEKDLKNLAKSRGVSQVIVNNARRMLQAKMQKR